MNKIILIIFILYMDFSYGIECGPDGWITSRGGGGEFEEYTNDYKFDKDKGTCYQKYVLRNKEEILESTWCWTMCTPEIKPGKIHGSTNPPITNKSHNPAVKGTPEQVSPDIIIGFHTQVQKSMGDFWAATNSSDMKLAKKVHREFWANLRRDFGFSADETSALSTTMKKYIVTIQEYQMEVWKSAEISHNNKTAVKSQKMIDLENEMPILFEKSLPFPKGSENHRAAMEGFHMTYKSSLSDANGLLSHAASHTAITLPQGQVLKIDTVTIDLMLKNLPHMMVAAENLLDENWAPK